MLVVVAAAQPNEAAAKRLARRALGPFGAEVPLLVGIAPPEVGGTPVDGPWPAPGAIACLEAGPTGDWRLAVVLGLAEDRCVALCLARD